MVYTGTADEARGFRPVTAQPAPARRGRRSWRRVLARLLVARRRTAEREIADIVARWGIELPDSASGRFRRIVNSTRSAAS